MSDPMEILETRIGPLVDWSSPAVLGRLSMRVRGVRFLAESIRAE